MNQNLLYSMLIGQLKNKNPQAYNEVNNLMHSGKSPDVVLNELLQSGRFTKQDIDKAKDYLRNTNNQNPNIKRF